MSEPQPEDPEKDAALYDRLLIESSEDELQYLIDNAPQLFSTKSLTSLRAFKDAVDRRLVAEPDTRAFSMNDHHEIRLRLWHDIADRLEAEIKSRSPEPTESSGNSARDGNHRTALASAELVLGLEGLRLVAPPEEKISTIRRLAEGTMSLEDYGIWLEQNSLPRARVPN